MLAKCPNCSATISARSTQCPQCHGQLRLPSRRASNAVFAWTFAAFNGLMLAWLAFYFATGRTTVEAVRIEQGAMTGAPMGGQLGVGFLMLLWFLGLLILGMCALFNLVHQSARRETPGRHAR